MSEFLEALNSTLEVNVGDVVQGEVISLQDNKQVIVGIIGSGMEGVIPLKELSALPIENLADVVKVGDVYDLIVVSTINDKENGGSYLLSKRRVDSRKIWEDLKVKFENGETVEGTVKDVIRGGLLVDLGVRGFVPASLISDRFVKDLNQFKGQTLTFKISDFDVTKQTLVLSRKEIIENEKAAKLQQVLDGLTVDTIVTGTVSRVTNFGAFIDLGGIDGLVHISELSHGHVRTVNQAVTVGQEVAVKILDIDRETGRISLSIKATTKAPWEIAAETYAVGQKVEAIVKRLTDFGAFVEVMPGVEGLVHVSQISHEHVTLPHTVLSVGQKIEASILEFLPNEQRMSLSIKALIEKPQPEVSEEVEEVYDVTANNTTVTIGDILSEQLQ